MNRIPDPRPRARKKQLITKEVGGELIVYDRESDRVHCLNSTAAFVWSHCDGRTSIAAMVQLLEEQTKTPVDEEIILHALEQLTRSKLLDDSNTVFATNELLSRRAVMRLGVATALITTIVAPAAAQAASCLPAGSSCVTNDACCSGDCVDNGRGGFQCN